MSGATAWKPAAASAGNWCRHEYHASGKPWQSTTRGPAPCSAICMRMPFASTNRWVVPLMACVRDSRAIHEHEHAPRVRAHILVDASRASDSRPSGSESSARLDELTLEDEDELRALVGMSRKPRSRLASHDLHLPAVRRRDVLHEHTRREGGWPPWKVAGVYAAHGAAVNPVHRPRLSSPSPSRPALVHPELP